MTLIKDNTKLLMFGQSSERLSFRSLEQSDFDDWLAFLRGCQFIKIHFG